MTPDLKYDASIRLDSATPPWEPYAPNIRGALVLDGRARRPPGPHPAAPLRRGLASGPSA